MKTCEQVPREQTRLFDEILYGWYQKRRLARRYYSRAWQGDLSRHQWRIKRMKPNPRLDVYRLRNGVDYEWLSPRLIERIKSNVKVGRNFKKFFEKL